MTMHLSIHGSLLVICLLFVGHAQSQAGVDDCSSPTDTIFTCTNQETISCDLVDDGINDCEDNSDEGYLFDCEPRAGPVYQFKCTMEDEDDYGSTFCFQISADHDNFVDCPDKSDEQKILGAECLGTSEDVTDPIGCVFFMPESFCNSSNQCECTPGRQAVSRDSDCEIRVRGTICETQLDCTDSYYGFFCNETNVCDCDEGFYVDEDDSTACIGNLLYENCTSDVECSNPIDNAECDADLQICVCDTLYIANMTTNYSCTARKLGDPCSSDAQCRTAMEEVECVNDVCACKEGAYANSDDDNCIQTLVGESCSSDSECALIRYGECSTSGECDCIDSEYLVDHMDRDCALGIGDLFCESNDNCTAQMSETFCHSGVCMCEYGYYAETHTNCEKRILGTQNCRNDTDCSNAIDNAVCRRGSCQCAGGYAPDPGSKSGKKCITDKQAACQDFACRYPWAVALLVIGLLAIAAVAVVLIIKKPWRKPAPGEKSDKSNIKPTTVAPVGNGGPIDIESAKPLWTLRPKSGIPMMYGNDARMQEAKDPETDAFYNGGLTAVETNDEARLLSADRRVRFDPGMPMTPGNIDVDFSPDPVNVSSPIEEADQSGTVDEEEGDGDKKKKKGKKGKKEKKEKKKKKGKNKNNNNSGENASGDLTKEDRDFMNSSPVFQRPMKVLNELRPLTAEHVTALVHQVHVEGQQMDRIRQLEKEKSEINLAQKLAKRKQRRDEGEDTTEAL